MAKYYSSTLQKGSKGDEVKKWQTYLNTQGYNLTVDGDFGDNTYAATVDYQTKKGLGADGIVGKNTWGAAGYSPYSTASTATAAPNVGKAPTAPTFNTTATAKPKTDTTSWNDSTQGKEALGNYNSAKDKVDNYGDFTYEDYVMGKDAQGAKDALNSHIANKPGEYQSQWQSQLDALMNQIMNRDKFSYDLNGDALYQQYKDKYIQQGKLAMGDAIGQASAMTGGYGNSYAQSVGQQQYQASLDNLNDIVPELYAMALDKYNMEGQDLYNQYGLVADRENTDYGRYRDNVSDYYNELDYLTGRYDSERNFDYGQYVDNRNLDYTLHQDGYNKLLDALGIAQSDYYNGADMFHTEQANKNNEAWNQYEASEAARQYANSLLQQGYQNEFGAWEASSENAWKQAQWDEAARQYANEEAWRQKEWDENQRRYEESKVTTSGNGGNGGNGGNDGGNTSGATYADTLWNATGTTDENGNPIFRNSEGKTQAFGAGVNPYTGTKNKDAKNGTFSNGYQPNNINGTKLKNSGMSTNITGKNQTIWEANGKYWLWRGDLNKYIEVDVSDLD